MMLFVEIILELFLVGLFLGVMLTYIFGHEFANDVADYFATVFDSKLNNYKFIIIISNIVMFPFFLGYGIPIIIAEQIKGEKNERNKIK